MDLINHSLQNVENAENTENIKNLIGGGNKSTKPLNFTLYRSTYGTRLVYFRRPNIPVSSISMHVNLGSRMEKDGDHGISHLLEHLVFKGSKNYPLMNHISIIVDSSGGYFNAYTSQRQTAYYVNIPDESLKEVIPVLSDMLLYPLLRTEDILGEKHIVKSELNKRMDNEIAFLNVALIQALFQDTQLEKDPGGTPGSVNQIKHESVREYHQKYYTKNNIIISIVSQKSPKEYLDELSKTGFGTFSKVDGGFNVNMPKQIAIKDLPKLPKIRLFNNKQSSQIHSLIGFRTEGYASMNKNTLILLNYLMGSSFNSLLFKRIREELNLAYTVNSDIHFYTDHGYLYIYAGISPDRLFDSKRNKGYINELFRILNYLKDVSSNEYDFDLDLFKKLVLKSSVFILEDANELANYAATQLMMGDSKPSLPVYKLQGINDVSLKDIMKIAKEIFIPNNCAITLYGNVNSNKIQNGLKQCLDILNIN